MVYRRSDFKIQEGGCLDFQQMFTGVKMMGKNQFQDYTVGKFFEIFLYNMIETYVHINK